MKGFTRKRNETWTAYYEVRDEEGRRRQKSKGGFRLKKEAEAYLRAQLAALDAGTWSEPKKATLAAFVREEFLPSLHRRATTLASYTDLLEGLVLPRIGGRALSALTPAVVRDLYAELLTSGRRRGPGGLSPRTVQYAGVVLSMALDHAVAMGYLARNPAAQVQRPTPKTPEAQAWSAEETAAFLRFVAEDRLYAAWLLFLTRGPRRGEVAGLRWSDVDLEAGRLSVVHTRVTVGYRPTSSTPMTKRSVRTVPLDATLVATLRAHRARQLEERLLLGPGWTDSGLVFTRPDGTALHPEYLTDRFERLARRADLRVIRLHDTRHTAASLALRTGIPIKVVSEWLGHASVQITYDTYSHVTPSMSEETGARLTALVLGGDDPKASDRGR